MNLFGEEEADSHRKALDSQCEQQLDSLSQRLNRSSAKLNALLQSQNKHKIDQWEELIVD